MHGAGTAPDSRETRYAEGIKTCPRPTYRRMALASV